MANNENRIILRVQDYLQKPVNDAEVSATAQRKRLEVSRINDKGAYAIENPPVGRVNIKVKSKELVDEAFYLDHRGGEFAQLVLLRKKGMPFYYRGKVKVPYKPDEEQVAVIMKPYNEELAASNGKARQFETLAPRFKKDSLTLLEKYKEQSKVGVLVAQFDKSASKKDKEAICLRLAEETDIQQVAPILDLTEEGPLALSDTLVIGLSPEAKEGYIETLASEYELEVSRKHNVLQGVYFLKQESGVLDYSLLDKCNKIAEEDNVEFAEPDVYTSYVDDAITPTDFLFPEQWDHPLIDTPDAWQELANQNFANTFGSPNVTIAVIDSGVDANHPDFNLNLTDGQPKISALFDFANMVANNNTMSSDHGTCCASAATSATNNPSAVAGVNEGVAGVAGNCHLIGIRRPSGLSAESFMSDIYLWAAGFNPGSAVAGFPAQLATGADIITSSFGHSLSIGSLTSSLMAATFDTISDNGRDGKGGLLFFSAANNNRDNDTNMDRPWGLYSRCFSVAASTLANDGVTELRAGYSNFGSDTEFCAPSNDVIGLPHNPPANYGAFTATRSGNPNNRDGTVGRPTVQTTLTAAVAAGATFFGVNSVAGMAVGQAIMLRAPGSGTTEAHIITAINAGINRVTINRGLFNAHPNGTQVFAAQADYRSNFGGTSYATPVCAGIAALVLSARPELTWPEVRDVLRMTAVKIDPGNTNATGRWRDEDGRISSDAGYLGPHFSEFYGYGRLDAAEAVRNAKNLQRFGITWQSDSDNDGDYNVFGKLINTNGTVVMDQIFRFWFFRFMITEAIATSGGENRFYRPDIGVAQNGDVVVVWQDDADQNGFYQIKARGFFADGREKFSTITVNSVASGQQLKPRLGMQTSGGFVVVWEDDTDQNGFYQIKMRGFNADGTQAFSQRTVNSDPSGQQLKPDIQVAQFGSFVVVWEDDRNENGLYQIRARGFFANGTERFSDITINTNGSGNQVKPSIAMNRWGTFVVAWEDDADGNGVYQIWARAFNANGTERVPAFNVNTANNGQQRKPAVGIASDASFVVAWEDDTDGNGFYQIKARAFDPNGVETISDFTVNSIPTRNQRKPDVAMTDDGDFAVVWEDNSAATNDYNIRMRGYFRDGTEMLEERIVNNSTNGNQLRPRIDVQNNFRFFFFPLPIPFPFPLEVAEI